MNKDAAEIFIILLYAVIQLLDVTLIQEAQHFLLELPAALAGDDLDQFDLALERFFHDAIQLRIDLLAAVVDVVQIQFEFCHVKSIRNPPFQNKWQFGFK